MSLSAQQIMYLRNYFLANEKVLNLVFSDAAQARFLSTTWDLIGFMLQSVTYNFLVENCNIV